MLRTYATPLKLDIKLSKIYLIYMLIIVGVTIVSLYFLVVNFWLKFSSVFFVCLFSIYVYLINNKSKSIIWSYDNQWKIIDDKIHNACLLPASLVFPWLTILNFKLESGRSRSVMIFSDAINAEQFRQLRVRLKVSSGKLFKKDNKRMLN